MKQCNFLEEKIWGDIYNLRVTTISKYGCFRVPGRVCFYENYWGDGSFGFIVFLQHE